MSRPPTDHAPRELDVFHCALTGMQLVEASAGTGKTWNLCALVLRLLLERGLALPQILVVTFTNAATAELRERIRARLAETLDALRGKGPSAASGKDRFVHDLLTTLRGRGLADADMQVRLDAALQTFDDAAIHTIHALCKGALEDHALSAGVPLAQELLADDGELRLQAAQDVWRRQVAGADDHALPPALAAHLLQCGDTPETWAALLRQRASQPTATLRWPEDIDAPADAGAALLAAFEHAQGLWQAEREHIVGLLHEARPRLNGNVYRETSLAAAIDEWDALLAGPDPMAPATDRVSLLTTTRLVPKKGQAPPQPHAFFDAAEALLAARTTRARDLEMARLRLLRTLLQEGPERLRQAKHERRVLAYDDLLQQLHARLTGPGGDALAMALRTRYPAALIDEFQDTDPLQFDIFRRLYAGRDAPLFLLGDPKQAIYAFRGADLHTYLSARAEARDEHTLAENQRSTEALLRGLNGLFGRHPRAFLLEGLRYQPVRRGAKPLPALHDARNPPPAALTLWQLPVADDGAALPKAAARAAAARATAAEITRQLAAARRGELSLDGRPVRAGDFAVLVRSHREGSEVRRALAACGVGAVELSQASVFTADEAEELHRVLAAMLEPTREPLVRAALATTLMGRDAAALEALGADEPGWLGVLANFAQDRQTWQVRGVAAMLRRWWDREGVAPRLLARPDGERRLTNLLHLADLLQTHAAEHAGPAALHRWLQSRIVQARRPGASTDEAAQLRLESDRHLVQIVTIHKSKGLEYPFVVAPFLWDGAAGGGRGRGRRPDAWAYHDDDGDQVLDFAAPLDDDGDIQARIAREAAGERLRLAYVALTRAVHRATVVVGHYRVGTSTKEPGRGPLAWLVAGSEADAATWPTTALPPETLAPAWVAFAADHPGDVALAPLPEGAVPLLPPDAGDTQRLAALGPPARLPAPWWIASYSALVHGGPRGAADPATAAADPGDAGLDHVAADRDRLLPPAMADLPDEPAADPAVTPRADTRDLPPDDILRFPRGALAGECLHAVFERADFTDPGSWPAAIDAALRTRPPPETGAAGALPAMLQRLLADVLATPLPLPEGAPPGPRTLTLRDIPAARRRPELEFTLPVERLTPAELTQALLRLGWPAPVLGFGVLRGYLRGFVDLVFEHDGRWGLLDWKSNFLGTTPAAHTATPVARAVHEAGYHLQALIYLLALHRWLRHRLPGYDYDRHVAGAWVLFVRGVRPGWADADGRPTGVWCTRPPRDVIEALSARLDGDAA